MPAVATVSRYIEAWYVPPANDNDVRHHTPARSLSNLDSRTDLSKLLHFPSLPITPDYLGPVDEEHLRAVLASALSSAKLLDSIAPAFEEYARQRVNNDGTLFSVDEATTSLASIFAAGLSSGFGAAAIGAATTNEATRLAALPAPGERPTWTAREEAGLGHLNPVEFYREVWKDLLDGGIYLDELNARDATLSRRIRTYCTDHGLHAKEFLPQPGHVRTTRLASELSREHAMAVLKIKERTRTSARRAITKHSAAMPNR